MTTYAAGRARIAWIAGAIHLSDGRSSVLVDAPEGIASALGEASAARLDGLLISSGVLRDQAGLLGLLDARSRRTTRPLQVVFPLGEERPAALLDAWTRGWPDTTPVIQDAVHPGAGVDVGDIEVTAVAVGRGEPVWLPEPSVRAVVALGWRIQLGDLRVGIARGPVPDAAVERVVRGTDLSVVEVGVQAWPRSDRRWRLRPDEAARIAAGAGVLWILGDDGTFGAAGEQ